MSNTSINHPALIDLGVNWKRGGYQHRILHLLATNPEGFTVNHLHSAAGQLSSSTTTTRKGLLQLKTLGLVVSVEKTDYWRASKKGLDLSMEIGPPPKGSVAKTRSTKAKRAEVYERPTYDCPELGKTCNRPGAYDAFALPSLIANRRVMPAWRNL